MSESAGADRCPRCGATFHCGAGDAAPCGCATLKLERAVLAELARRYRGCLCLQCLRALARGEPPAAPALSPP